jgi:CheY-like chemotaxis protein
MIKIEYGNKRFLVIESVDQSRDTLKVFANTLGALKVDTSHHAPDILSLCSNVQFDVILLGYDLGDDKKNGQQILEELRSKKLISRQCAIVMITAEISQAMVLAALEHKPDEYLAKPYTLNDLSVRLQRSFHKKMAMLDIYNAMDSNNYQEVISLCDSAIAANSIYKAECLGIKSRQYFELKEFDKARDIYDSYNGARNCQWAAIGLGKIALEENDYDLAISHFCDVVKNYPLYLTAYDWLAKSYQLNNQSFIAEETLGKALLVSPLSVGRLEKYADLCLNNENYDRATHAFSKTADLAYHSVHKKAENTLNFVEALLEYGQQLSSLEVRKLSYKAFKAISVMTKDFSSSEVKIRTKLLSARLHQKIKDPQLSKETLQDAEKLLNQFKHQLSDSGTLAIAKSLIALGRRSYANNLLDDLAITNPNNSTILNKIDSLCSISLKSNHRITAQNALEIGANLYRNKQYSLAILELKKALIHFPNHVSIQLNLLQVLLVTVEKDIDRTNNLEQAEILIKGLKELESDSESYIRFQKLNDNYKLILSTMIKI